MMEPSETQKLVVVLRNEALLIAGVMLKFGAALLILETLAWIGAATHDTVMPDGPAVHATVAAVTQK